MIEAPLAPPASVEAILLPSDRFFVRVVPLATEADVGAQVELALESLAPFPVKLLYYGYLLSPTRDSALIFAAYRKRFSVEETQSWSEARAVLPTFLALLGDAPTVPTIRLWTQNQGIIAMAWDGNSPLPVVVMARATELPADAEQRLALETEIRARAELEMAAVQEFSGDATVSHDESKRTLVLGLQGGDSGNISISLDRDEIETADVRDKEFLTSQRTLLRRDRLLWRGFLVCLGGLAALVLLETGLLAGRIWLKGIKDVVQKQIPAVQKIETAQSLSVRIEEMTQRQLMPFEMLALINQNRPASIQFVRSTTTGLYSMEIDAQTANAADVGLYETALRAAPELAAIETRDLRSREGVTSFTLEITFKPESLRQEGGS